MMVAMVFIIMLNVSHAQLSRDQLADLILDAQTANLTQFRKGTVTVETNYISKTADGEKRATVSGSITWNEHNWLATLYPNDPSHSFNIPSYRQNPSANPEKLTIYFDTTNFYVFNYETKELLVLPASKFDRTFVFANLSPINNWSRYCGPFMMASRSWVDIIKPNKKLFPEMTDWNITESAANRYTIKRTDPRGNSEVNVSMQHSGHVTNSRYVATRGQTTLSAYEWSSINLSGKTAFYLKSWNTTKTRPDKAEEQYTYRVLSYDFNSKSADDLSLNSFYALLPSGVTTKNYMGGGTQRKVSLPLTETELDGLAERIRKNGFNRGEK